MDRRTLQSVNNWAAIQHLRETDPDMTERRLAEIAHIQGLDLPHQPGIHPRVGPRGVAFWQVYCIGCTHQYGYVAMACRFGLWDAPKQLVDAHTVLSQVDAAMTAPAVLDPVEAAG